MLALTLVDNPRPTPIGLKSWRMFFGMIATPAAMRLRNSSGSTPSTAATYFISSVILPRPACSICVMGIAPSSMRRGGRPHFADDGPLDPSRVLNPALDLLPQLGRQERELIVAHLVGPGDPPDLASRLDGVGLLHALHLVRQPLQLLDPAHVVDDALAPRAGTRSGNGVGGRHQDRDRMGHVGVLVVRPDGVHHHRVLIVTRRLLDADLRVRSFPLEVDGLADVVQQARALGQSRVEAQLGRHDRGELGDLDRVHQDVLAVGCPVAQAPQDTHEIRVDTRDFELPERLLPRAQHLSLDATLALLHQLLDPPGVNVAVLDQPLQRQPRHLPLDRVEAGQDHGVRLLVDQQLHAGGLFEGPDVLSLVADDASLQLFARELERGDAALGGPFGRGPLDGQGDDLARLHLGLLLGLLPRLADHPGGFEAHLLPHVGEEHLLGVLDGEPGDAAKLIVQLGRGAPGPIALLQGLAVRLLDVPFALLEGPLTGAQPRILLTQDRLALLKDALPLFAIPDLALQLLLETRLRPEPLLAALQEGLALLVFRFLQAPVDDLPALAANSVNLCPAEAPPEQPTEKTSGHEK